MKKYLLFIVMALFAMIAAACGSSTSSEENTAEPAEKNEAPTEVTVTHELGEATVPVNPEKVVVFDFGSLDTMAELGVEPVGLPKENIPDYLSQFEDEKYENTGSLKEPDFEKINELAPDLIIISSRQMDLYDQFAEIAPTVYLAVDDANYMESFKKNATTIGQIFDKEAEVEEKLAAIDEKVAALNEKASTMEGNGLVILANEGKISAYGPASRFGIIHDVFGVKPADENIEVSTHGQSVSFEYLVETDPDYLFVVDRGAVVVDGESSVKQVVENDLVKGTKAVKNDNVIYLDPNVWYLSGGGLQSVPAQADEIEKAIAE
ncbi:siderophore ABC transporter substrate-binding protein [Domibacillus sp. A3M-37]|uniref:siderophore ABC transporter substrate-binding protein n=2 Tax=Bacillaceae TaxID=186817 RepID=UPI00061819F8|nr:MULTISPECIES: siderophore ABC transporter substrate-binding protein [Domibacillus]MCP3761075.1 siderophore ABC transporter substrate-binding protein [Domibacillus sp. A3M-37]